MHYYRLYFINAVGHIEDVRERMLADDAAAITEAQRLRHNGSVEIWCQGVRIETVAPGGLHRAG